MAPGSSRSVPQMSPADADILLHVLQASVQQQQQPIHPGFSTYRQSSGVYPSGGNDASILSGQLCAPSVPLAAGTGRNGGFNAGSTGSFGFIDQDTSWGPGQGHDTAGSAGKIMNSFHSGSSAGQDLPEMCTTHFPSSFARCSSSTDDRLAQLPSLIGQIVADQVQTALTKQLGTLGSNITETARSSRFLGEQVGKRICSPQAALHQQVLALITSQSVSAQFRENTSWSQPQARKEHLTVHGSSECLSDVVPAALKQKCQEPAISQEQLQQQLLTSLELITRDLRQQVAQTAASPAGRIPAASASFPLFSIENNGHSPKHSSGEPHLHHTSSVPDASPLTAPGPLVQSLEGMHALSAMIGTDLEQMQCLPRADEQLQRRWQPLETSDSLLVTFNSVSSNTKIPEEDWRPLPPPLRHGSSISSGCTSLSVDVDPTTPRHSDKEIQMHKSGSRLYEPYNCGGPEALKRKRLEQRLDQGSGLTDEKSKIAREDDVDSAKKRCLPSLHKPVLERLHALLDTLAMLDKAFDYVKHLQRQLEYCLAAAASRKSSFTPAVFARLLVST
eukprot:jgi/Mesen1/2021/ME000148S01123